MQHRMCKLCLLEKDLQDSHFVGKAVYKRLMEPSLDNPHPVIVTSDYAKQSTTQVRDFVFCFDCEQTFNHRGEAWMHRRIATTAEFPLLDLFAQQTPLFAEEGYKLYDGTRIPNLDCAALLHYGAGIFFKAAAHVWDCEGLPYGIDLGAHTESLRKFVLDGVDLPPDLVIGLSLASTPPRFLGFFPPVAMDDPECLKYKFYVSGVLYTLMVGNDIPMASRQHSFSLKGSKLIFLMDDVSEQGRDIMKQLAARSKLSPKLEKFLKEGRRPQS
jgi:hypothetical protein